ncbi:MAG: M48 family metallopeptidase [Planctomycetota bacterium]|jgi:predicted Zn-dependent protease
MKFVQKELSETADVSAGEGSQFQEMWKLIATALAIIIAIYFTTGFIADYVTENISIEREKQLFSKFPIPTENKVVPEKYNAKLLKLNKILKKISAHPDVPSLDYKLHVMPNNKVNAFAFPGGHIGVTSGLLDSLESDISHAFVLGHELGHFKNRDHLRGMGRSIGASLCYAIVFGGSSGGNLLAGNTLQFMQKKYSRDQEAKADEFGVTF